MPITFRFESNIVVIAMEGDYSVEEIYNTAQQVLAHPQIPASPKLLLDLRHSASIAKRSSESVNRVARFFGSISARFSNKIALVAANDLQYGLMRMGSAGAESRGVKSEVFRTLDDAQAWLTS